jgi:hypothetical protein
MAGMVGMAVGIMAEARVPVVYFLGWARWLEV